MAELAVPAVITAATHLMRAAQWTAATDLLRAATADNPADQRALSLARAEVAVDQDFAQQTDHAAPALAAAAEALTALPDPTAAWDLEMLFLRKKYATKLFSTSQQSDPGAGGEELAGWVEGLRDRAPDGARRGMACFYAGLIADNLLGKHETAFACYTEALALGEGCSDDLLVSLALRHLGDHAHTAGDLEQARRQWEQSTELRQKVGHLLGALAQQTLLAVLLRAEGDTAGARALATEVKRWSEQVGLPFISKQTAELMA
ncbi:tetratricopeptide repeat protein [Kribbella sp. NPDC049174]|uniref:tetratricopeptide repeat protein n=1 Tax=Kribbella sp. NPDC049174 TaxID=3364112 RepID=UPI003722518E